MTDFLRGFVEFWDPILLWYFGSLNLFYGILFALSVFEVAKHWALASKLDLTERLPEEAFPPVSVVVPAFNEEAVIVPSVDALLSLDYPSYEVIVVNDDSTDRTLELLSETYDLYEVPPAFTHRLETPPVRGYYRSRRDPRLLVVDKAKGPIATRSAPLNVGINASRYPYCAIIDADTIMEPRALRRLTRIMFVDPRPVAGTGGTIRVANGVRFRGGVPIAPRGPRNWLASFQVPEYFRAFLFGRLGWNRLGGNILISGAFGLWQKRLMVAVGGYDEASIAEDLELTLNIHRLLKDRREPYDVPFVPDPVVWTEVPETIQMLGSQRERWHRGLLGTLFRHWRMFLNPRYGFIGLLTLPYYVLGEMLAPVVEVTGYGVIAAGLWLGVLNVPHALLFFALAFGYQMLLSLGAVWLEYLTFRVYPRARDYARIVVFALLEPLGYRQLTVWWRLKGFWTFLRDVSSWGSQARKGFATETGSGGGPGDGAADGG
ncbi:MAG TPA: glycosyltransferase [Gemmatimonadota bacterium]|nr:glycosyltransferase [Gemmatimonadota bacterium]